MLQLGGKISDDGKLSVFDQQKLTDWRQKHAGREIVLSLKVKRKMRSNPQNGYYWTVVVPMVTEAINSYGNEYSNDETHEFLKSRFNNREVEMSEGIMVSLPMSTTELDTIEFSHYIETIQQWASAVLGIYIPSPNEQLTIDHYLNQP
jgi:hypothetical protein